MIPVSATETQDGIEEKGGKERCKHHARVSKEWRDRGGGGIRERFGDMAVEMEKLCGTEFTFCTKEEEETEEEEEEA